MVSPSPLVAIAPCWGGGPFRFASLPSTASIVPFCLRAKCLRRLRRRRGRALPAKCRGVAPVVDQTLRSIGLKIRERPLRSPESLILK